jgi:ATP-dependent Clp protease ATP-binding subunit ClpC
MFERFTAKARHTIVLAQEEARFLNHNYIGTEHILLGLIHETQGIGARVLAQFGLTLEGTREEVTAIVGQGKGNTPTGHIPFTPRAKKTLELALREALQLHHDYIGTEHILLGLIREGEGVAAQVMRQHADLLKIRMAVLDLAPADSPADQPRRAWLRRVTARRMTSEPGEQSSEAAEQSLLAATPAADATLSTAAKLAGGEPVGSHHLLLAALTDANSAAARILASLGVNLTQAKDALRDADVTGTTDEQPEEAGRRQMNIKVTDELLTIVAADETLVTSANAALKAIRELSGPDASAGGTIRGADLSGLPATNLAKAWTALHDAFSAIATIAQAAAQEDAKAKAQSQVEPQAEPETGTDAG